MDVPRLPNPRLQRFREAYLAMAGFYRPQAPSDGFGNIQLTREQVADLERLDNEAIAYAVSVDKEENTRSFWIGASDFGTNRAFIWAIEAARCLAGGNRVAAKKLLKMALKDVDQNLKQCPSRPDERG